MFKPGQSGNLAGRPKGSVNQKWSNVSYWFEIIETNIEHLKPADKIVIAKWAMEILIGKMKQVESPQDSRQNADEALKLLKELEAEAQNGKQA